MPLFPDVPNVPGVPKVLRQVGALTEVLTLLSSDVLAGLFNGESPLWGIFLNGVPVLTPDTFMDFGWRATWRVATYPLERGAFESYDKVENPYQVRIRIASGGDISNRQDLIDQVDAIAGTLDLYDVVTPEKIYLGVNIENVSLHRGSHNGAGMVAFEIAFTEIREDADAEFTSTKTPSGQKQINGGPVQTREPTPKETSTFNGRFY